jgi:3'-phosphoadenosine 5'-phosphosulfate sulfotransferase (PAPS reductase)/FAD synthetase
MENLRANEAPVLMENTKIESFSVFHPDVFERNRRYYRPVYADEITPRMCKSAGLSPDRAVIDDDGNKIAKEAKKDEPVKAPEVSPSAVKVETPAEPEPAKEQDPIADIEDWTAKEMREYAQTHDIPVHPAARRNGLIAAITRHYKQLKAQGED